MARYCRLDDLDQRMLQAMRWRWRRALRGRKLGVGGAQQRTISVMLKDRCSGAVGGRKKKKKKLPRPTRNDHG